MSTLIAPRCLIEGMTSGARFGVTSRSYANGFVRTAALFRSGRGNETCSRPGVRGKGKVTQPAEGGRPLRSVNASKPTVAYRCSSAICDFWWASGVAPPHRPDGIYGRFNGGPWCCTTKSLRLSLPLIGDDIKPGGPSYRTRLKVRSVFVEVRFGHLFILKGQVKTRQHHALKASRAGCSAPPAKARSGPAILGLQIVAMHPNSGELGIRHEDFSRINRHMPCQGRR